MVVSFDQQAPVIQIGRNMALTVRSTGKQIRQVREEDKGLCPLDLTAFSQVGLQTCGKM